MIAEWWSVSHVIADGRDDPKEADFERLPTTDALNKSSPCSKKALGATETRVRPKAAELLPVPRRLSCNHTPTGTAMSATRVLTFFLT